MAEILPPDPTWRIEPTRTDSPGECNVTGESSGPFLVTDLYVMWAGRFCPTVELVQRLAAAIGWEPPKGDAYDVGQEVAHLRQRVDELEQEQQHWHWLEAAINHTLKEGLVVTKHRDIKLREPRNWRPVEPDPED